jgi:hypothetical protein
MCPRIGGYSASSIPMFDNPRDVAVVEYTWNHRRGHSARPGGASFAVWIYKPERFRQHWAEGSDHYHLLVSLVASTSTHTHNKEDHLSSIAECVYCQLVPMLPKFRRKEEVPRGYFLGRTWTKIDYKINVHAVFFCRFMWRSHTRN